jgi:hypothetical protein
MAKRVAVTTLRFLGSTAPTAISGVSITAIILGGAVNPFELLLVGGRGSWLGALPDGVRCRGFIETGGIVGVRGTEEDGTLSRGAVPENDRLMAGLG